MTIMVIQRQSPSTTNNQSGTWGRTVKLQIGATHNELNGYFVFWAVAQIIGLSVIDFYRKQRRRRHDEHDDTTTITVGSNRTSSHAL
jgi:hypothetical protein